MFPGIWDISYILKALATYIPQVLALEEKCNPSRAPLFIRGLDPGKIQTEWEGEGKKNPKRGTSETCKTSELQLSKRGEPLIPVQLQTCSARRCWRLRATPVAGIAAPCDRRIPKSKSQGRGRRLWWGRVGEGDVGSGRERVGGWWALWAGAKGNGDARYTQGASETPAPSVWEGIQGGASRAKYLLQISGEYR